MSTFTCLKCSYSWQGEEKSPRCPACNHPYVRIRKAQRSAAQRKCDNVEQVDLAEGVAK